MKCYDLQILFSAKEIIDEITKCSTMTALRLEGNTVGVEAAEAIAEALAKHPEFQVTYETLFSKKIFNLSADVC